tara:strand:- start:806 stop:991 length:186 start_codon:yes stop_codon:yes gene_type:complete
MVNTLREERKSKTGHVLLSKVFVVALFLVFHFLPFCNRKGLFRFLNEEGVRFLFFFEFLKE